jgi:ribosomal protein L7/L12
VVDVVDRSRLINECTKLKESDVGVEDMMSYLRNEGCNKIDTMVVLLEVLGINLGEAKHLVHLSSTWRDVKERDDAFHDKLIDALAEMPGVTVNRS